MQTTTNPTPVFEPYPTHSAERPCPECNGEGAYEVQDAGPYSYVALEPTYSVVKCVECDGTGLVPVERCDRCGLTEIDSGEHAWDECQCFEDDLIAWEQGDMQPEVMVAAEHVAEYLRGHYPNGGVIYHGAFKSDAAWARRVAVVVSDLREHATGDAERQLADRLEVLADRVAA